MTPEKRDKLLRRIEIAFNKQNRYKQLFIECEMAYNAEYDDKGRIKAKRKNTMKRSELYVPLIKTTCDIIHSIFKNSFLANGCPIEIKRVGMRSEHDLILQNALNVLVKERWNNASHRIGLSRAVLSAIYLPLGIVALYNDNGELKTKHIPIRDIAFDPNATSINDVDYVAYRWQQSKIDVKEKFESGFYQSKEKELLLKNHISHRIITKEIYVRDIEQGRRVWRLATFINNEVVREAIFDTLPFHFGYCLEAMPPVCDDAYLAEKYYIGVYGSCLPLRVKEIQAEYNIKRNQKIDLVEMQIDPMIAVDKSKGAVAIQDLLDRAKTVRVDVNDGGRIQDLIQPLIFGNPNDIVPEISMLQNEYEIATGVNSVMTGQTSPSDRRAMGALQAVNASSSMRIEAMLQTLCDTMLNSYARAFVENIYRYTSDEDFIYITENPQIIDVIGPQALREHKSLRFDIKTHFGTTIGQDVEIGQLQGLLGVLAQSNLTAPQLLAPLIKQLTILMLGDNAPIEQIDAAFEQIQAQQEMAAMQQAQSNELENMQAASEIAQPKEQMLSEDEITAMGGI